MLSCNCFATPLHVNYFQPVFRYVFKGPSDKSKETKEKKPRHIS